MNNFTTTSSTVERNYRRNATAIRATEFFKGNHWQNGDGYTGQKPPRALPGWAFIMADLQAGFDSDNVIKEVVETHSNGLLGREPIWSFLPANPAAQTVSTETKSFENVTGETLTPWWNEREALATMQRAMEIVLCEGIAVYRLFFPKSLNDVTISATSLTDALDMIYFEVVAADRGGVFTDPDTQQKIGVFLFEEHDSNGDVAANCAELSFLDDNGDTVCRVVRDKGAASEYGPYQLGGRLLIYEVKRDPLITEQVQANQRAVNMAHTSMDRNVNLAGNRSTTVTNAQPPQPLTPANQAPIITSQTTKTDNRFPGTFSTGPGRVNFLMGVPIFAEDGLTIVGYTNPNVNTSDPVPVETFERTITVKKSAIYSQCHQRHVMIVDKADTSARAREVARREYERSLKKSKTKFDGLGRWKLETTVRLAANIINQVSRYLPLRADFNTLIDAGVPDPAFIQEVMEMRKPGGPKLQPIISDETARNLCGVDDAGAELKRIEAEAKLPAAQPEPMPKDVLGDQPGAASGAVN